MIDRNKKNKLNDYELLYLISESNEDALEILLTKYDNLIYSKLNKLNFPYPDMEDYLQESRMLLKEAIDKYDDSYGKTFAKFFELLLIRFLYREKGKIIKNSKLFYSETAVLNVVTVKENAEQYVCVEEIKDKIKEILNDSERKIYLLYFVKNYSIDSIAIKLGIKKKAIYNKIYNIKEKIKELDCRLTN